MDQKQAKITEEKLKMWKGKLITIEAEYQDIMKRRGEAMAMGDLRENAAFQMLSEDADTWRVKIDEVRKIIAKLEGEPEKGGAKVTSNK